MWLNENAGVIMLVFGLLTLVILAALAWAVLTLRSRLAVQRLKFTGLCAKDVVTRAEYASLIVGNRSVSEIALRELGVKDGGVAYDLTSLYRKKAGLDAGAHIVIEQRRSIALRLEREELGWLFAAGKRSNARPLRLYAIDLTGNLYEGRIPAVGKMLSTLPAAASKPSAPIVPAEEKQTQPDDRA